MNRISSCKGQGRTMAAKETNVGSRDSSPCCVRMIGRRRSCLGLGRSWR